MTKKLLNLTFIAILIAICTTQSFSQFSTYHKEDVLGQVVKKNIDRPTYVDLGNPYQARNANMDTLVYMNFDTSSTIPDFNNGGPWFNFSYDNLTTANGDPTEWFQADSVAIQDVATGDTLRFTNMGLSISWMTGFANGNRNALGTPGITITEPGAILQFTTMPVQGPQWMDGMTIKVDDIGDAQSPTADTLTQLKQYRGSGDGPLWDTTYQWMTVPGDTLHTQYNYDPSLASFGDSGNATVALMYVELSLDAYVGQTIHISFYHDSDDDNGIFLDDIVVMQPLASGLSDDNFAYSKLYPNPASSDVTFEFNAFDNAENSVELFDVNSRLVKSVNINNDGFGVQKVNIPTSDLNRGIYFVNYYNGKEKIVKKLFIE